MLKINHLCLQVLENDPHATLCYLDQSTDPPTVHVHTADRHARSTAQLAERLSGLPVCVHHGPRLTTLLKWPPHELPANEHQACQDEPVALGTQIQPRTARWVGTAGAPARWRTSDGRDHWGILSNWHVMIVGKGAIGDTQHQPFTNRPAIAKLSAWSAVSPTEPNRLDAAIADAYIEGKHTIDNRIIGVGPLGPAPLAATVGLSVLKSGRTTAVTRGVCVAVGAAAKVNYGQFVATFADQDVYQDVTGSFSAAGDSGSAVVSQASKSICSLLFAGGGNTTIGCPIRYAIAQFGLLFPVFP